MQVPVHPRKRIRSIRKVDSAGYYNKNTIKLIKGGKDYFNLLERMIDQAKESIHLQTYIFEADATGKRIAHALIRAARRNVKVAVLLDGYASQAIPNWLVESFRELNIRFDWFQPFWKTKRFYFGRRLHHKVVLIDSKKVIIGGLNISDRYNDTAQGNAWLDWALFAEGDIAVAVKRICQRRSRISWPEKHHPRPDLSIPLVTENFECKVRTRVNDWVNRKMQIWNSHMEMFRRAKSHIIIMSPYFMPGYSFRKKMSEAAKSGVRVRVILGRKSDVLLARYSEQYLYPWLLRNNIEIYEYQKNVLHGKIAAYDTKWVTSGSYNINNISAFASVELNLDVDNVQFAELVEDELTNIIDEECEQITMDHYKKRAGLLQRFLYRSSYDIIRILFFIFTFYFRQRD